MKENGKELWNLQQFCVVIDISEFSKYFVLFCCITKVVNSSSLRQLYVNFFTSLTSSKHFVSPTGNPLFNRNWIRGTIPFHLGGSLSLNHMKHKKSVVCLVHLSKYGAHAIYLSWEFVTFFIKSLSRFLCYYEGQSYDNLKYFLSCNLLNIKGTQWLHFSM